MKDQLKKIFRDPTNLVTLVVPNKSRLSKWNLQWKLRMFIIVLAVLNSIATEVMEEVELVEEDALVDQIKLQTGGQDK